MSDELFELIGHPRRHADMRRAIAIDPTDQHIQVSDVPVLAFFVGFGVFSVGQEAARLFSPFRKRLRRRRSPAFTIVQPNRRDTQNEKHAQHRMCENTPRTKMSSSTFRTRPPAFAP